MDVTPPPMIVDAYEEFWQYAEGDAPCHVETTDDSDTGAYELYWDQADGE
ncbi:MAG: hypothetical protein U0746_02110 [Gemmataceae bacterium]